MDSLGTDTASGADPAGTGSDDTAENELTQKAFVLYQAVNLAVNVHDTSIDCTTVRKCIYSLHPPAMSAAA
jgi:hypothetical protein